MWGLGSARAAREAREKEERRAAHELSVAVAEGRKRAASAAKAALEGELRTRLALDAELAGAARAAREEREAAEKRERHELSRGVAEGRRLHSTSRARGGSSPQLSTSDYDTGHSSETGRHRPETLNQVGRAVARRLCAGHPRLLLTP